MHITFVQNQIKYRNIFSSALCFEYTEIQAVSGIKGFGEFL